MLCIVYNPFELIAEAKLCVNKFWELRVCFRYKLQERISTDAKKERTFHQFF